MCVLEALKNEFDRLDALVSQTEKCTNNALKKQMQKIKNTMVLLNKLVRIPKMVKAIQI